MPRARRRRQTHRIALVSPFPLLLTATINPPAGTPFLARRDPELRMDDYCRGLRQHLLADDDAIDRIVFVDNSNSDTRPLLEVVEEVAPTKDVEILSFDGRSYPVEHGRSVGETYLIADALEHSRILSSLGADDLFWKVTGRLRVRNLDTLVKSTPNCDLYIDFRRYRHRWVRLFATTPAAFRRLFLTRIDILRQDQLPPAFVAPEQRLFDNLLPERAEFAIVPRLRVEPVIEGISGVGEDYRRPRRRVESAVRRVTRRVLPALWI